LKIAVNTRLLLPHRMEGIARYIYETTRRMVLEHPEDEFHFLFDRPYDDKFIFADNIVPHVLSPPSRHPLLWYIWFEWAVPRILNKIKPDVFYSGDMYMSLKTKVPTVMVSHDLNYEHYPETLPKSVKNYYLKYSPKFHHAAAHLISVSEATRQDIINTYGIDARKITVAHNAVPEGFAPLPDPTATRQLYTEGCPYFVYVGSLHPRKNIKRLLEAFDLFKSQTECNHKLVIYGRNAWKTSEIYKTYENLNHKSEVIFLKSEAVSVQQILGAAFGLSYVSVFEGFGIPILEAFASCVPVITSDSSSMPEVAGGAAILVDPFDGQSIADGMTCLLKEDELREKLIQKGKKQLEKFSWDRSAEIIYAKLQLVNRRSS